LEDSLTFFPASSLAPVIRQKTLTANPEVGELLSSLLPLVDDETMTQMSGQIELGADGKLDSGDEKSIEAVVKDFLTAKGLLASSQSSASATTAPVTIQGTAGLTTTSPISTTTLVTPAVPSPVGKKN
jgi:hypothetical protein